MRIRRHILSVLLLMFIVLPVALAFGQDREQQYREELETDPENPSLLYNLACVVSIDGRVDEAMSLLRRSILAGFSSYEHLLVNDPDLTNLRTDQSFESKIRGYIDERRMRLREQLTTEPYRVKDIHFELATIAAEAGDTAQVVSELRNAFSTGFKDFFKLWNSSSFGPYWSHDQFRNLGDSAYAALYGWHGTTEQKVFGLMTVWAEARANFAFFDQVPRLDWDAECRAAIPRVIAASDEIEYYWILQELAAKLRDGHTGVSLPNAIQQSFDNLPLEVELVDGAMLARHIGKTKAFIQAGPKPGMEIVEINGAPANDYFTQQVLDRHCYGRPVATAAIGAMQLFQGPAEDSVSLTWLDLSGAKESGVFARGMIQADSTKFIFSTWNTRPLARFQQLDNGILYCELKSFNHREIVQEFEAVFDTLDLTAINGVILDVRRNTGGNSNFGWEIISHFIDSSIQTARWRSRKYIPTFRAWGREETWHDGGLMSEIQPAESNVFTGPLVVLIGPRTFSAAEDFVVPLDYADRAILVGDSTGGSTGQPLQVLLPGGGAFRVCTKRDTYPDGTEFVGIGIAPDIRVLSTRGDIIAGRDRQLEKAVGIIATRNE